MSKFSTMPEELKNLLIDWMSTRTWEESRDMLKAHAEQLLSDAAFRVVAGLLVVQDKEDEHYKCNKAVFAWHGDVLRKARATSIDAAYAECSTPPVSQVLQGLSNELRQAIEAFIVIDSSSSQLVETVKKYPILMTGEGTTSLERLLDEMQTTGQIKEMEYITGRYADLKRLIAIFIGPMNRGLIALMQAPFFTIHETIKQHPVLLDDETLKRFDELLVKTEQSGDTLLAEELRLRMREVRSIRKALGK